MTLRITRYSPPTISRNAEVSPIEPACIPKNSVLNESVPAVPAKGVAEVTASETGSVNRVIEAGKETSSIILGGNGGICKVMPQAAEHLLYYDYRRRAAYCRLPKRQCGRQVHTEQQPCYDCRHILYCIRLFQSLVP